MLFGRLVPASKGFCPVQVKRLEKLGIAKRDPSEFTMEEARIRFIVDVI